jgi:hypothetical protein
MDTTKRHPAEDHFDHSIRGQKPAHHDHVKKSGGPYEEGGGHGFNHQDGFAHESGGGHKGKSSGNVNEIVHTPPADSGEHHSGAKTHGGIDFTVPPVKE